MLAQWIGELVGQMHNNRVSKTQLAKHMGVSREYVSMVLNGRRCPAGAKDRFVAALAQIIEAKNNSDAPTE